MVWCVMETTERFGNTTRLIGACREDSITAPELWDIICKFDTREEADEYSKILCKLLDLQYAKSYPDE